MAVVPAIDNIVNVKPVSEVDAEADDAGFAVLGSCV